MMDELNDLIYKFESEDLSFVDMVHLIGLLIDDKNKTEESGQKDAKRYRFLRNQDIEIDFPRSGIFIGLIPENLCVTEEDADKAIDERMSKEGEPE